MGPDLMQLATLILVGVIAVATVGGWIWVMRVLAAARRRDDELRRALASQDPGPVLHGLVQQVREGNRRLTNLEKRIEKLEALQKVRIVRPAEYDETVHPGS